MNIQVGKWGNSLGVRIPGAIAKELGLSNRSELDLQEVAGSIVLRPRVKKTIEYDFEEMLASITPETLHSETDWGQPMGKEQW